MKKKLSGKCNAKRARSHRKHGHEVRFSHWNGMHCVYEWRNVAAERAQCRKPEGE